MARLQHAVLFEPGTLSSHVRQAAASMASELPEVVYKYVQKVAKSAYTVTDEDVQLLLQAGYSEEAIFELTVSAALGAGLTRLKRGLASLEEGDNDAIAQH
jgi:alkylhydroperoxidase family enzyme